MDLWIRSQDGKIISKINEDLIVVGNTIKKLDETGFVDLATYAKEERALEVLDEIQEVLMPKIKVLQSVNAENNIDDLVSRPTIQECGKVELLQYSDYVYEMPKE